MGTNCSENEWTDGQLCKKPLLFKVEEGPQET